MKKLLLISLLFIISGCDNENYIDIPAEYHCEQGWYSNDKCHKNHLYKTVCQKKELAKFNIDCARIANPMSAEEEEDLFAECAKQGKFIYCESIYYEQQKN